MKYDARAVNSDAVNHQRPKQPSSRQKMIKLGVEACLRPISSACIMAEGA